MTHEDLTAIQLLNIEVSTFINTTARGSCNQDHQLLVGLLYPTALLRLQIAVD